MFDLWWTANGQFNRLSQDWYRFRDSGRMEELVGLGGKPEVRAWNHDNTTAAPLPTVFHTPASQQ